MSHSGDEEEEEEYFFESLDRILSSPPSSSSLSSDNDGEGIRSPFIPFPDYAPSASSSTDQNPSMAAVSMYHIWITEPAPVEERRKRLLYQMGLSGDKTLSRLKSTTTAGATTSSIGDGDAGNDDRVSPIRCGREGDMKRSVSYDNHLQANGQQGNKSTDGNFNSAMTRSRSDSAAATATPCSNASFNLQSNHCNSPFPLPIHSNQSSIHSIQSDTGNTPPVYNNAHTLLHSKHGSNSRFLTAGFASPNKPPIGKARRTMEEIKMDSHNSTHTPVVPADDNDLDDSGITVEPTRLCTIKNLDNGKEFVVNEVGEDGMWNKLREVGTGRQLTQEEFMMSVGHSPIVQELMRRQNVEESSRKKDDLDCNGNSSGSKSKKKGGWLKSIKSVACTVTGHRERRSSDERDTSSEKGGRRSSSATDDSQDVLFHTPQRTKVRQYGKSCKELTALYMSQEIQAHNGSIWSIKFSSDGRYLASAGEDRVIHIWQVLESKRSGDLFTEKFDDGNLNPFFVLNGSPELALVSSNMENHLEKKKRGKVSYSRKFMNLDHIVVPENIFALSEKPICSFRGHLADVLDLSWSKSQFHYLLSSSMDKTVRLWDMSSNSCLKVFSHSDYVTCIQFNPVNDDYFISGSLDAKVRIWSVQDRQVVDWNDLHEMVTAACYTPDGQGALVGSHKGSCRLYSTHDNKLHQKSEIDLQNKKKRSHLKKITGFQFAPGSSSEVLVTSADSRIRVVDGADLVHKFKGFRNTNSQISASLTANGKYVVCASEDSHVYVWRYDSDSRPSRSKGVTITRSYEHFHCPDVSVAIPWPCISVRGPQEASCGEQNAASTTSTQTPAEAANGHEVSPVDYGCTDSPLRKSVTNSNSNSFSDRVAATWPEEKLLGPTDKHVSQSNGELCSGKSAWGMVIVTAGLGGEIRTFQNFGLPVRI